MPRVIYDTWRKLFRLPPAWKKTVVIVDYLPTATIGALRFRARCLGAVRRFFDERGYFEVDTPLMSRDIVLDAFLEPFVVSEAYNRTDYYLQTSPEAGMKRLLCAGAGAIYQLGHVFRSDERGVKHNPEFTMVEWYRVEDNHLAQMQVTEDLLHTVSQLTASPRFFPRPFRRTTYLEAFEKYVGIDPFRIETERLPEVAAARRISVPESLETTDRDGWLNLLLAMCVEPHLGSEIPEFLLDYPASQCALAKTRNEPHAVAERFELYCDGMELCNGYHELLDAAELRVRNEKQLELRLREGNRRLPLESRLLEAMEEGMPACAGVALGFDRLVMLLGGYERIDEVIPFPIDRA